MAITFYSTTGKWGCFSNFSPHPVVWKGKNFPTSEHLYQSLKFKDPAVKKQIQNAKSPKVAALIGRDPKNQMVKGWDSIRVAVMTTVVTEKFRQNEEARKTLFLSGNQRIIEDSRKDSFWGCGADGTGDNHLGRILMSVRDALRVEFKVPYLEPEKPFSVLEIIGETIE